MSCVCVLFDGHAPSCPRCWTAYVFANGQVYCDKCHICRFLSDAEVYWKAQQDGIVSYCPKGRIIFLNKEKTMFMCNCLDETTGG
jgi:hypothetical protein